MDPERDRVKAAVPGEDLLDLTLSDDEIDLAVLVYPSTVEGILTSHKGLV
jgi:hypothetical protein